MHSARALPLSQALDALSRGTPDAPNHCRHDENTVTEKAGALLWRACLLVPLVFHFPSAITHERGKPVGLVVLLQSGAHRVQYLQRLVVDDLGGLRK